MSDPCANCGNPESEEVWFDDGIRKYSTSMCKKCIRSFQDECRELYDAIQQRINPKPWWKRIFTRKDS